MVRHGRNGSDLTNMEKLTEDLASWSLLNRNDSTEDLLIAGFASSSVK